MILHVMLRQGLSCWTSSPLPIHSLMRKIIIMIIVIVKGVGGLAWGRPPAQAPVRDPDRGGAAGLVPGRLEESGNNLCVHVAIEAKLLAQYPQAFDHTLRRGVRRSHDAR